MDNHDDLDALPEEPVVQELARALDCYLCSSVFPSFGGRLYCEKCRKQFFLDL